MERTELAKMLMDLAEEIMEQYPNQSMIIGAVAGLTHYFEDEALLPLSDMAALYSQCGLEIVDTMENKGD